MKTCAVIIILVCVVLTLATQTWQEDPFLWLEEVEGDDALGWVEAQNSETLGVLGETDAFRALYDDALEILTAQDRIAYPSTVGEVVYNFWTDAEHRRGIYRRTTLEDYLAGDPEWETVLDIDALAESEGVPWAFAGMTCLAPEYRHCLVNLARGGSDATESREFDLPSASFVEDGFFLPEAKSSVAWIDPDSLLVGTDAGSGSMTTSGYARTVKLWTRGTSLREARVVFEAETTDMGVFAQSFETREGSVPAIMHRPEFFDGFLYILRDGELRKIDVPSDADPGIVGDHLVVYVRTPWTVAGRTFATGTVIATALDDFLTGDRDFSVIVESGPRSTVRGTTPAGDSLLVSVLDNVEGQLWRYEVTDGAWTGARIDAPRMGSVGVNDVDLHSNRFFFSYSSFLQPTTLYLHDDDGSIRSVRQSPDRFDASGLQINQFETASKDGTRIPYFVVAKDALALNGSHPTLLYAYGGFEIPMLSGYSAVRGKAWIERGGVYVVANLRGGGEFGPAWHRSALKENRQRAYDDFIAVAEDLIRRGYTSPERLGIEGGSNGGLLTGVAMTQRPDLYGAVVISVPLLDMKRYNKLLAGASWMAEYGDPDLDEEWAFISQYSPYQNVHAGRDYPRPFINTTTRDDRVHPGHARKMAAKMQAQGHDVYYYENTEGGHGAGVTPEQRARMLALEYAYLWAQLAGDAE
ncbi:MAG: prolyl oligopeptidase family serine peptidase [Acidobacteriota bacterium]|nr:prolyl oligopeptidase family serine peptidase [Acidobacteriota bacterium]